MTVRVGIIADCLYKGHVSIGKYLRGLLRGFLKVKTCDVDIMLLTRDNLTSKINFIDVLHIPDAGRSAPSLSLLYVCKKARVPVVVTNHGMANRVLPPNQVYGKVISRQRLKDEVSLTSWHLAKKLISCIIVPSRSEKYVISKVLMYPEDRIIAIYHGVNHELYRPLPQDVCHEILMKKYGINSDFILHVSSYQPKKNVERIIAAYALLKRKYNIKEKLVIVGNQPKKRLLGLALNLGLNPGDIILTGVVPEEELPYFYSAAKVFVFPSLHESFGLPILEAMACGCPVVTSNVFACLEVADDAALLVDPFSVKEIAIAILKILEDEALRERLAKKGLKRARLFTWERAALMHLRVYKAVISL